MRRTTCRGCDQSRKGNTAALYWWWRELDDAGNLVVVALYIHRLLLETFRSLRFFFHFLSLMICWTHQFRIKLIKWRYYAAEIRLKEWRAIQSETLIRSEWQVSKPYIVSIKTLYSCIQHPHILRVFLMYMCAVGTKRIANPRCVLTHIATYV